MKHANLLSSETRFAPDGETSLGDGRAREWKGPPFWEDWRGQLPDEEIEFVRAIFEEFCSSWE